LFKKAFIGDRVINLLVAEELCKTELGDSQLGQAYSTIVSDKNFARAAFLHFGKIMTGTEVEAWVAERVSSGEIDKVKAFVESMTSDHELKELGIPILEAQKNQSGDMASVLEHLQSMSINFTFKSERVGGTDHVPEFKTSLITTKYPVVEVVTSSKKSGRAACCEKLRELI